MSGVESYQYATWRVIPDFQRGEFINAGVILYSKRLRFLKARVSLNRQRLHSLNQQADYDEILKHLLIRQRIAAGDPTAGEPARLNDSQRFGWLVCPSSTIIQPSEVHTGLCEDPETELDHLMKLLVL